METVLLVYMVFACFMCLFAVVVAITQIVQDAKGQRIEKRTPELVKVEPIKEEVGNAISFSVANNLTLDEKYQTLAPEYKCYYDEIVQYAMMKDSVKCYKTTRYEEYKIRKTRLVRLQIKRGVVICEFILLNEDFKNYITENKVSVKQSPVVLRVLNPEAVQAAKNSIDIAVKTAAVEKERQVELKRTKQREAKELK